LIRQSQKNNTLVCVGLDSDLNKLPSSFRSSRQPILEFNRAIVDATADLVCAFKPNSAFYEALGSEGIAQLKATCDFIHTNYPDVPVILDAKRGDIGSTSEAYARYTFDYLGADAVTLHPYLGHEALKPFLQRGEKGNIILCRTSNPGAGELQDLVVEGEPMYKRVARQVVTEWNSNGNCLLVVGATYPKELGAVRQIATDMVFLVPGVGTQGGKVEDIIPEGIRPDGRGMIINSSSGIIFASKGPDFAERAQEQTNILRISINNYRPN